MVKIAGCERPLVLVALVVPLLVATGRHRAQSTGPDELSPFLGRWHGESLCVARNTACQDETVIYHITEPPAKSDSVLVAADKLVRGKAIPMGTLEFHYDPEQRQLVCEYAQGVWRLRVEDGKIEGMLTRPNHLVFRRLSLRKDS